MTKPEEGRRQFGSLSFRGKSWWLRYRIGSGEKQKEQWENLRTTSRRKAEEQAAVIGDRVGRGEHTLPDVKKVRFEDLEAMLRNDYTVKGNRSLWRLDYTFAKHLRPWFGHMRALGITTDVVKEYEAERLTSGASRATVNYELALLRRAFNLAIKSRRLQSKPYIETPNPRNARKGFFEPEDFAAVMAELPDDIRPVMHFAYLTGWRVKSEVVPLTWDRVDFRASVVRLDTNTTKNTEGRTFPFAALPELGALLQARREYTDAVQRETKQMVRLVFHRNGKPIKSYRHGWAAACNRAATTKGEGGLSVVVRPQLLGRVVHDFRRTAVRNLVRAGVPERVAMALTGHRTREVFDRYNIVNEADLTTGVARLAAHLGGDVSPDQASLQGRGKEGENRAKSHLAVVGGAR